MTKFDHSTRLLARQALRDAVRQWPLSGQEAGLDGDDERAAEERISYVFGAEPPAEVARVAPSAAARLRRAPSIARLLLGVLAMAFGVGLAWAATARLRRA